MKLTRRRVWVTASIFVIVAALSLFILVMLSGDRITQANCNRIEIGMSLGQVSEILGTPPTEARSNIITISDPVDCTEYVWDGKAGTVTVVITNGVFRRGFTPNQNY